MFVSPLLFSTVPIGVVEYDSAPLFLGLVVGVFLCVLVLAVTIGIHDTWRLQRREKIPAQPPTSTAELSDAA
jgi:hypothetical protein